MHGLRCLFTIQNSEPSPSSNAQATAAAVRHVTPRRTIVLGHLATIIIIIIIITIPALQYINREINKENNPFVSEKRMLEEQLMSDSLGSQHSAPTQKGNVQ